MAVDKELCHMSLKILSTISTGVMAGGSFYINMVESPARMTHDAASAITMWKPSFLRAKHIQSKLAAIASMLAFGVYWCDRGNSNSKNWLLAGGTMLLIIPYTLAFIRPVNDQLLETEKCVAVKGNDWIVENLERWNKLHSVRTLLSLGAFSVMVYTLIK